MAEHNVIGKIGENLAVSFLMKQGFIILERNYRVTQGELDIIAKKDEKLRFIEVKSVKVRGCSQLDKLIIRPEDNLTSAKWYKLLIAIEFYKSHRGVSHETKYQIDLACVYVDTEKREGRVKLIENIYKEKE
jgi:putative endonuclease